MPSFQLRETAVAAELLYYGLTTGAGVQTLGEEYCDILQVTGMQQLKASWNVIHGTWFMTTHKVSHIMLLVKCSTQSTCTHKKHNVQAILAPLCSAHKQPVVAVSGPTGVPPGTVQRGLLVLLQALLPHLAEQLGGTTEAPLQPAPWASHPSNDNSSRPNPDVASSSEDISLVPLEVELNLRMFGMSCGV